jgi:hypothetical protein
MAGSNAAKVRSVSWQLRSDRASHSHDFEEVEGEEEGREEEEEEQ